MGAAPRPFAYIAAAFGCALTGSATAQDSGAAGALFARGLADMQDGRYEAGCPALSESYRLDPRAGAVFTLAECERGWGRIASALAHYQDYLRYFETMPPAQQQAQRARELIARRERAALESKVPTITLVLPSSAPAGVVVARDGKLLGAPSLGKPLPLDPGTHRFTTQAPGGPMHEQTITIATGDRIRLELTVQLPRGGGAAPAAAQAVQAAPSPAASTPASRPWVFVAGGIGVAGLGVGAVTGILAISEKSTIEANCAGVACSREGLDAAKRGQAMGWASTVGFGVGLAGLATGAVLLLTEGSGTRAQRAGGPRIEPLITSAVGGEAGASFGVKRSW
jgi:hypothetical protein